MSEIPPPKKARVARAKSDGKYLGAHGPTNKFQAEWLEHPAPAAMSLIITTCQENEPEAAQPPLPRPLSQPKSFERKPRASGRGIGLGSEV